jgi:hypothetical protein
LENSSKCLPCASPQGFTISIASGSVAECRSQCVSGQAGYKGLQPCYECAPGTVSKPGTECKGTKLVLAPGWNQDRVENATFNASDLCDGSSKGSVECEACPPGKFHDKTFSNEVCVACRGSTYSPSNGSTACIACPAGSEIYDETSPKISASQCSSQCPIGTYTSETRACLPCIHGSYSSASGVSFCHSCAIGTFTPQFAASSCSRCPTGMNTEKEGAKSIYDCAGAFAKSLNPCVSQTNIQANQSLNTLQDLWNRLSSNSSRTDSKSSIVMNSSTLPARLFWFFQVFTARDNITLFNTTCDLSSGLNAVTGDGPAFGVLQCTGFVSSIWGFPDESEIGRSKRLAPALTVIFTEIKGRMNETEFEMSMLVMVSNYSSSWSPFRYSGIPVFHGISVKSWVHNIGFGGEGKVLDYLVVHASTADLTLANCVMCRILSEEHPRMSKSRFLFQRGLGFFARGAYLRTRIDGTHNLLGMERMMQKVMLLIDRL